MGYQVIEDNGSVTESRRGAVIASGLAINGDLTCKEKLVIEGLVEGSIVVPTGRVQISSQGRVAGHVIGDTIIVAGRVRGNLYAKERVIVKSSADVRGRIFAPKVALEKGGKYRGRINMDSKARAQATARTKILKRHPESL